jgi:hypothetical protein
MKIRIGHIQITIAIVIVIFAILSANYLTAFFTGYVPNINQKAGIMEDQDVQLSQEDLFQLNATLTLIMLGILTIVYGIAVITIILAIFLFFQGLIHLHEGKKKKKLLDLFDHHFVVTALLTILTLFIIVFLINL